jgi:hypothetical protein
MDIHDFFVFHLLMIQQFFNSVLLPYVLSISCSVLAAYIVHTEDVGDSNLARCFSVSIGVLVVTFYQSARSNTRKEWEPLAASLLQRITSKNFDL